MQGAAPTAVWFGPYQKAQEAHPRHDPRTQAELAGVGHAHIVLDLDPQLWDQFANLRHRGRPPIRQNPRDSLMQPVQCLCSDKSPVGTFPPGFIFAVCSGTPDWSELGLDKSRFLWYNI